MEENKNNQEIMFDNFEAVSEENIKMFEDKLSEIENLTDAELEIIAGGEGENAGPSLTMGRSSFLMLARAASNEIRLGNKFMAIKLMHLIWAEYRFDPIYINLREEYRKKFNEDIGRYGL